MVAPTQSSVGERSLPPLKSRPRFIAVAAASSPVGVKSSTALTADRSRSLKRSPLTTRTFRRPSSPAPSNMLSTASLFMSRVAMVNSTSLPVFRLIQWAASADVTRTDLPGLYATEMKSASRSRAGSSRAGSGPRGGVKSHTKRTWLGSRLRSSTMVVTVA